MKKDPRKKTVTYYVYVLECDDGSLYAGIARDVAKRFAQHATGAGSKYVHARGAKRIVHTERLRSRSAALKREAAIKRMSRMEKLALFS